MLAEHHAIVLHGSKDLRLESVPTIAPGPHEIQIAPRATGICGTDLHYYALGKNGMFTVKTPLILGHESAGEVVAVGTEVSNIKVGDRVAIEPQRPCFKCILCRRGQCNLCLKLKFGGSASSQPPIQGSLQDLFNHPAELVYVLPDSISFTEGAIIEPLSVAIHAVKRSSLSAGQRVLITGAGAIGLLCAAVARLSGASSIAMIDIEQSRLDFAVHKGFANEVFKIPFNDGRDESKVNFASRMAKEALKVFSPGQYDINFECTGIEICANICLFSAAPGGKVVIVGMGNPLQEISLGTAAVKEVDILAVWRYTTAFPTAVTLLQTKQIDVTPLITHQFDLMDAKAAFKLIEQKPSDLIKCVITTGALKK